jgi:hypothetical protein
MSKDKKQNPSFSKSKQTKIEKKESPKGAEKSPEPKPEPKQAAPLTGRELKLKIAADRKKRLS